MAAGLSAFVWRRFFGVSCTACAAFVFQMRNGAILNRWPYLAEETASDKQHRLARITTARAYANMAALWAADLREACESERQESLQLLERRAAERQVLQAPAGLPPPHPDGSRHF